MCMKNKGVVKRVLLLSSIAIFILILLIIFWPGKKTKSEHCVGIVMTGKATESGWNKLHYDGLKEVCEELGAKLVVKENIKESKEQCEQAIHELAKEKVNLIILSSYGYAAKVSDVIKKYPEITFYSESFDHGVPGINSYFARMYQARYLSGIVAGMQTKSNTIGYVAAMANSEVNRGINAFTLGVQRVNKDAKVVVSWTDSWDDAEKEKEIATRLIDEKNVDVITYHQNQPNVIKVAEEKKIASIGYHEAFDGASENFLTASEFHFGQIYREILMDYYRGKSNAVESYWIGIEQDAIGLAEYSKKVTQETIDEIEKAKNEMISGRDVFSGVIYDTEHNLRCDNGETISDEQLLNHFDWYVEGVEFYEK